MATNRYIKIDPEECKGCQVCTRACSRNCIIMGSQINKMGYKYAIFSGKGCTACGACFYGCPECGAITVFVDNVEDPAPDKQESNP
jgi:ferredoxin